MPITKPKAGRGWDFACDSYGKVQHSKKACVYTVTQEPGRGELIVTIAARIPNWDDARLMASAPTMLAALEDAAETVEAFMLGKIPNQHRMAELGRILKNSRAAIAKAQGESA